MYFYFLTAFLFFIPTLFETAHPDLKGKVQNKNYLVGGIIVVLIIQMGLRWETGSDWIPYLEHFKSQNTATPFTNPDYSFEKGYNFLVSISKWLVADYSFFLFIHAVIFFLLLKKGFKFFTPYPLVALLLFYVSFIGVWGSNRQFIAAGLGLISLTYLYEKKWWLYGLFLFLASLFHTTALLLLAFLVLRKNYSNIVIGSAIVVSILIGFSSLPLKIFSLFGGVNELTAFKTQVYLENAKENTVDISLIGLVKRLGIFVVFFIFRHKITKSSPKFNFIFNGFILGLCFYFIFANSLAIMISRGSFYFNMLEPILLSYLFVLPKDRKLSFLLMLIILAYSFLTFYQSISAYPDLFDPYKGLFYNTGFKRTMH